MVCSQALPVSLAHFSLSGQHRLLDETFRLRPVFREEPGCGKTDERSSEFHSGQLVGGEGVMRPRIPGREAELGRTGFCEPAMDPTCDGKSLGGFQLGVMKSGFFLKKKKSHPAVWGLDCSQAKDAGVSGSGARNVRKWPR